MREEKMIDILLELEGIKETNINVYDGSDHRPPSREIWFEYPDGTKIKECPDYLHDHNAIQRVIDLLKIDHTRTNKHSEYGAYYTGLIQIVQCPEILKATPRQKCEAILKALNKWED